MARLGPPLKSNNLIQLERAWHQKWTRRAKTTAGTNRSSELIPALSPVCTKHESFHLCFLSSDAGMTRTTMIVKLHPGQAKRLSAYLEGQQARTVLGTLKIFLQQTKIFADFRLRGAPPRPGRAGGRGQELDLRARDLLHLPAAGHRHQAHHRGGGGRGRRRVTP